MSPDQLPDIKAEPGEIVAQPMPMPEPGPMGEQYLEIAWHSGFKWWEMPARYSFPSRATAELFMSGFADYTHYRIVRIPGDDKGAEHVE